jgi:IS5 family transposase
MKQQSLATAGFELAAKRTRKREFLDEMNLMVPWSELVALIQPHAPAGKTVRPPIAVETMLRIYFMQQWFGPSDPAMEEALHDVPLYCQFARLDPGLSRLPAEGESTSNSAAVSSCERSPLKGFSRCCCADHP